MKILKIALFALLFTTAFIACKKDNDHASAPVEGLFVGKYGFGNESPDTEYKLNVKPGGVFQEIGVNSGAPTGQGNWQFNGNTLTATYTMLFSPYNKYSVSATFNSSTGKLVGTWGYDNNPSDGGKIDMTKQ